MEIVGKVILIPGVQSGISKNTGKEWNLKTFVIETQEQYPRKVAIEIFGTDRINNNPVELDQIVTASVDIESREVNGRWFTSVRAWKVAQGDTTQVAAPAAQPVTQTAPAAQPVIQTTAANVETFDGNADGNSDLPF